MELKFFDSYIENLSERLKRYGPRVSVDKAHFPSRYCVKLELGDQEANNDKRISIPVGGSFRSQVIANEFKEYLSQRLYTGLSPKFYIEKIDSNWSLVDQINHFTPTAIYFYDIFIIENDL